MLLEEIQRQKNMFIFELDRDPFFGRVFTGTISRIELVTLLQQSIHYVKHSATLLDVGGQNAAGSKDILCRKADEERGHEAWAVADLLRLGVRKEQILRSRPAPAVARYCGYHRRAVKRCGKSFLSTAYLLESLAYERGGMTSENFSKRSRIPGVSRALTFIEKHAVADVQHIRDLEDHLRDISGWITPLERKEMVEGAALTRRLYPRFFQIER
jgi:thiaminase